VSFYVLFACKCVLLPGNNPIAVNKYIIYHIIKHSKNEVVAPKEEEEEEGEDEEEEGEDEEEEEEKKEKKTKVKDGEKKKEEEEEEEMKNKKNMITKDVRSNHNPLSLLTQYNVTTIKRNHPS
jgi:hypothetical protein